MEKLSSCHSDKKTRAAARVVDSHREPGNRSVATQRFVPDGDGALVMPASALGGGVGCCACTILANIAANSRLRTSTAERRSRTIRQETFAELDKTCLAHLRTTRNRATPRSPSGATTSWNRPDLGRRRRHRSCCEHETPNATVIAASARMTKRNVDRLFFMIESFDPPPGWLPTQPSPPLCNSRPARCQAMQFSGRNAPNLYGRL